VDFQHVGRVFAGVDPGKSGAVALLHESGKVEFVPYTEPGCWDNVLDQSFYPGESLHVAVERLFARPGRLSSAKANFELGRCCGEIETLLRKNRTPYEAVTPQRWQKAFGISGDKDTHIEAAKRLFPGVDLRRTEKCKVSFDGYADALLIATWHAWETLGEKRTFWQGQ
jgi:hypothetical protein